MTSIVLDIVLLAALGLCVLQGIRKGLILSAAGVLIVFISIWGGGLLAERFQEPVTQMLLPVISWVTDDATDEAARGMGRVSDIKAPAEVETVARGAFAGLGISEKEIDRLTEGVLSAMKETGASLRAGISHVFLSKVAYALLYLFGYALFCILLTLLANFIAALFKLPGLHLLDKVGGGALGFVYGVIFLFAVAFVLRFTGIAVSQEVIGKSLLGNFFVNANPLSGMIMR